MTVTSYRIQCDNCTNQKVIRERDMEESDWTINSKHALSGVCPSCAGSHDDADAHSEVPFEDLDNIGASGAENLREAGIITKQDVENASDDEILDISWVGEAGLESIREAV